MIDILLLPLTIFDPVFLIVNVVCFGAGFIYSMYNA